LTFANEKSEWVARNKIVTHRRQAEKFALSFAFSRKSKEYKGLPDNKVVYFLLLLYMHAACH